MRFFHSGLFNILLIAFLLIKPSFAFEDVQWPVSTVNADLLTNANSIVRMYSERLKIIDESSFSVEVHKVITVLNENGKGDDIFFVNYDPQTIPDFKSIIIFNAAGHEINKVNSRDLIDQSMVSNASLFEDSRFLAYEPLVSTYPYTVEMKYKVTFKHGLFGLFSFQPVDDYNIAVEKASFEVEYPADLPVAIKTYWMEGYEAAESTNRGNMVKTWQFASLNAINSEDYSPRLSSLTPMVVFAQKKFRFDSYQGNADTWNEYGKWERQLIDGKDNLPEERVAFVKALVDTISNDRDKVKAIYKYMQSRTRYLNITLGIGGLQPFDAATVDKNGYGDCKALSNYMMALLKAADIPSDYTLVKARNGFHNIIEDLPVSQFNHIILCVPLDGDTVWLECTSQQAPFGYLGDFTDNRPVLLIKEDGGHLVRTYQYTHNDNVRSNFTEVSVDLQGNATADVNLSRKGIFYDDYVYPLILAPDDQKKWIYSQFSFPNYNLNSYSLSAIEAEINSEVQIELSVNLRSVANMSGDRMFVPIKTFLDGLPSPSRVRRRTLPFEVKVPITATDTIVYHLPDKYQPEAEVPSYNFQSEFGQYQITGTWSGNQLQLIRTYTNITGSFPAEKYKEFYDFHQSIERAENQSISFLRK